MANISTSRAQILGTIGKDMETKYTPNGAMIGTFAIAVSKYEKGKDNRTVWYSVKVFGKQAENLQDKIKKGLQCFVDGELDVPEWETNGVKNRKVEIIASEVKVEYKKTEDTGNSNQGGQQDDPDSLPF